MKQVIPKSVSFPKLSQYISHMEMYIFADNI